MDDEHYEFFTVYISFFVIISTISLVFICSDAGSRSRPPYKTTKYLWILSQFATSLIAHWRLPSRTGIPHRIHRWNLARSPIRRWCAINYFILMGLKIFFGILMDFHMFTVSHRSHILTHQQRIHFHVNAWTHPTRIRATNNQRLNARINFSFIFLASPSSSFFALECWSMAGPGHTWPIPFHVMMVVVVVVGLVCDLVCPPHIVCPAIITLLRMLFMLLTLQQTNNERMKFDTATNFSKKCINEGNTVAFALCSNVFDACHSESNLTSIHFTGIFNNVFSRFIYQLLEHNTNIIKWCMWAGECWMGPRNLITFFFPIFSLSLSRALLRCLFLRRALVCCRQFLCLSRHCAFIQRQQTFLFNSYWDGLRRWRSHWTVSFVSAFRRFFSGAIWHGIETSAATAVVLVSNAIAQNFKAIFLVSIILSFRGTSTQSPLCTRRGTVCPNAFVKCLLFPFVCSNSSGNVFVFSFRFVFGGEPETIYTFGMRMKIAMQLFSFVRSFFFDFGARTFFLFSKILNSSGERFMKRKLPFYKQLGMAVPVAMGAFKALSARALI